MTSSDAREEREDHRRGSGGRSLPEWASFFVALASVLAVAGVFVADLRGAEQPAVPVARVDGPIERIGTSYQVPVVVENRGDITAADVQVVAELEADGSTREAEKMLPFLTGGADERVVFLFSDDPAEGELTVEVRSYAKP